KKAKKRSRRLKQLDEEGRHELRIALKKLRYSAEFFASLFSRKESGAFLRRLSRLQDCFGTMNDIATSNAILRRASEDATEQSAADIRRAAAFASGWLSAGGEPTWKRTRKAWKRFSRSESFWA